MMRAIQNPAPLMLVLMSIVYAQTGDIEKAQDLASKYISDVEKKLVSVGTPIPQSWQDFVTIRWPFKRHEDREHFLDGLQKAGVPG